MNLYVKESGQNNPETIIFLHGDRLAGWMWDEQLKAFADYHLMVPDLPEHGRSQKTGSFTIKRAAEMMVALIKTRAHGGKAHLVGISLGAQIIIQILSIAPEVVNSAFISGTLVRSTPPTETFLKLLNQLTEFYVPIKSNHLFIKSYMRSYNMPKNLFSTFKESTCMIDSDSATRIIKESALFTMPDGLKNADASVVVMIGEKDYGAVKKSAKDLVNVLPNSKGASALGVGHMWNMENPELFNRVLRGFLITNDLKNNYNKSKRNLNKKIKV